MAERLPCVLRHQLFQPGLGLLMFEKGETRRLKHPSPFGPRVRPAHIDDPDSLDWRARRLNSEDARRLAGLNAAPEPFFSGHKQMLIKRIGRDCDLDPFAAAGDDRED